VGAYRKSSATGAAYVFIESAGTWSQFAKATSDGFDDDFGFSVAISGSTAVVGAPRRLQYRGAAYAFKFIQR